MDWNAYIVGMARDWIIRQLTLGEFDSRRHVWRKAIGMACKIAVLAYGINLIAHWIMYQVDLLPYTLQAGLIAATVLTPTIAFSVALAVYVVLGFAIYDLGVSRAELEHLSRTDMLSGLANRRAFMEQFDQCNREKTLLIVDIDRFKMVNDKYGHAVGDEVIVKVANMLTSVFAGRGVCARIGGEEFAVCSSDMDFAEFAALGEIARHRIAQMRTEVDGEAFSVTVSGGITRAFPGQEFADIFSRADKALYDAKEGGRNRIVLSYDSASPPRKSVQSDPVVHSSRN
ncbi:MAG: GGDEF domain-containing protein [Hoeflea sp.]|uniref:GGDEF domain-containing protein n=1 Tax=Hoeflea sp. TaxID=1940281 RepID=UPI001D91A965|nr:GGDEF domain-containing protein [Hoeflea sp.]MBU4530012.1 GGDEF domain-containing protein [Alphaproteobacteria bacterium]MBU4543239.1 GGDEF domain-containing protein [Alphaproteobacteria bacterium]MBU4550221.1 GGDEF domain-containing protein [Alphaproteobacteria bacterium]MBV1722505.1 GGDEF domain-containing protein [Hoeflea sp.]MBV1761655.1 GGDEF domain-containing protein [Hoeflea sp.]